MPAITRSMLLKMASSGAYRASFSLLGDVIARVGPLDRIVRRMATRVWFSIADRWSSYFRAVSGGSLEEFASSLRTADFLSPRDFYRRFTAASCSRGGKTVDRNLPIVAICFEGDLYRDKLGAIPVKLAGAGYNVLPLCGTRVWGKGPPQVSAASMCCVGGSIWGDVRAHLDVRAFLCHMASGELPGDENVVFFPHDIGDLNGDIQETISRPNINYVFAPSPAVIDKYRRVAERALSRRRNRGTRRLWLIPGGYPKLDATIRQFEMARTAPDCVMYVPTNMTRDVRRFGDVRRWGQSIVGALLASSGDLKVVFRPHPSMVAEQPVRDIVARYSGESRFVLDTAPSFGVEKYGCAAVMVTDLSSSAYTFAYSTLRPSIFFSPADDDMRRHFGEIRFILDRNQVGRVAASPEEVGQAAKALIGSAGTQAEGIRRHRDRAVFNVGSSEDYFVKHMRYVMDRTGHPDWTCIRVSK